MNSAQQPERVTIADFRNHFQTRMNNVGWVLVSIFCAAASLMLAIITLVSIPLVLLTVGIPMFFGAVLATRPLAGWHRTLAAKLLDREIGSPYLPRRRGNLLVQAQGVAVDRATWRDALWLLANGTVGLALSIVGLVEAILDLIFWWLPPGILLRLYAYLAAGLLSPTEATTLAQRVAQLAETRAEARDTSAAELRRIERDLHDGAQARLVALSMSLGMAEEALQRDPDAAAQLITEAKATSQAALGDLRHLVRGIHPPVLADRGLIGAISALVLAAPIPIEVRGELPQRENAPIEAAAYFVVAEAVGNVIKHSGASAASITIERRPGQLRLEVRDDGRGGADETLGTGLRGIRKRLAAFDGTLEVSSPVGGPTSVIMTLPAAAPLN